MYLRVNQLGQADGQLALQSHRLLAGLGDEHDSGRRCRRRMNR